MANSFLYKDSRFSVGDTLSISYKIHEGEKERIQIFTGILIKIRGDSPENRMITLRKISKTGIGVERILPLQSPYIGDIKLAKKSTYSRAKLYFLKNLSEQKLRQKIYKSK